MSRNLSEMSLQELWKLFPIVLKNHNPDYKLWYEEEKNKIENLIDKNLIVRISHMGSTAVNGLIAKPTIDILVEISEETDIGIITSKLKDFGWMLMFEENEPEFWLIFNKGYTPLGYAEKVYHLHIRFHRDWSELYFRDYLQL
ncbi:MAG: GrpB family protein, partial [Candidatus Delongbacteria bacterium]|nr:GrpB family protein [Candidatus Delongbacteria bacterium]